METLTMHDRNEMRKIQDICIKKLLRAGMTDKSIVIHSWNPSGMWAITINDMKKHIFPNLQENFKYYIETIV